MKSLMPTVKASGLDSIRLLQVWFHIPQVAFESAVSGLIPTNPSHLSLHPLWVQGVQGVQEEEEEEVQS